MTNSPEPALPRIRRAALPADSRAAFRSPHVTIAFVDPPEVAVERLLAVRHEPRRNPAFREATTTFEKDLFVDLNTEDDSGLPWRFLDGARDPSAIASPVAM